jgi:hypothetical protein
MMTQWITALAVYLGLVDASVWSLVQAVHLPEKS